MMSLVKLTHKTCPLSQTTPGLAGSVVGRPAVRSAHRLSLGNAPRGKRVTPAPSLAPA